MEINAKETEIASKKDEIYNIKKEYAEEGEEVTKDNIDEKVSDNDITDEDEKKEVEDLRIEIPYDELQLERLNSQYAQIEKDLSDAEKILNGTTKVSYVGKDGEEKTDTLDKAIEELQAIEDEKKEAFIAEGGTEEEMEQILEADKVELPEDKTTIEDIRKLLNDVKVKRQALDYLQEFMPETVKRFQEEFDKAVKKADKAIEETEAWLEKNDPNYEK